MSNVALVTGCAGFIGRVLVEQLLAKGHHVIGVDKETYASRFDLLPRCHDRFLLSRRDIVELEHLHGADALFHLAAESHVDNSISDSRRFLATNVGGTHHLLELIRGQRPHDRPTLIHVSTDEVYGDLPEEEVDGRPYASREDDTLYPSSPYSASKAAADMLVLAWQRTYGLKARIVRPSNVYGPNQFPEKLIPKTIRSWQLGKRMTIHGDGTQSRMWLHVEDCARALIAVWEMGADGEIFNVPGDTEMSVREVVSRLTRLCGGGKEPLWGCERPGGDRRYRVDGTLLRRLGWVPQGDLVRDLEGIVRHELEAGIRI